MLLYVHRYPVAYSYLLCTLADTHYCITTYHVREVHKHILHLLVIAVIEFDVHPLLEQSRPCNVMKVLTVMLYSISGIRPIALAELQLVQVI